MFSANAANYNIEFWDSTCWLPLTYPHKNPQPLSRVGVFWGSENPDLYPHPPYPYPCTPKGFQTLAHHYFHLNHHHHPPQPPTFTSSPLPPTITTSHNLHSTMAHTNDTSHNKMTPWRHSNQASTSWLDTTSRWQCGMSTVPSGHPMKSDGSDTHGQCHLQQQPQWWWWLGSGGGVSAARRSATPQIPVNWQNHSQPLSPTPTIAMSPSHTHCFDGTNDHNDKWWHTMMILIVIVIVVSPLYPTSSLANIPPPPDKQQRPQPRHPSPATIDHNHDQSHLTTITAHNKTWP